MKNRLAVFFFYDKNGIVRNYIYRYLAGLKKICSKIIFVSNGKIIIKSKYKLLEIVDEIIERENFGFDAWAYKEAIEQYTWNKVYTFDELVLANFTCYGPIFPFENVFHKMDLSTCDFWGLVKHPEQETYLLSGGRGYIYEHIMSYFTVIKKNMLHSSLFRNYWTNLPVITSKVESTALHETFFTKYFEDNGFISDSYVRLDDFKTKCYNSSLLMANELLRNKCPLLKRRAFICPDYLNFLDVSLSDFAKNILIFLKKNTDYDPELIWQDILSTSKLSILRNNLHSISIPKEYDIKPHKVHTICYFIQKKCHRDIIELISKKICNNFFYWIYSEQDNLDNYFRSTNIKLIYVSRIDYYKCIKKIQQNSISKKITCVFFHNESKYSRSISDLDFYRYILDNLISDELLSYQENEFVKSNCKLFTPYPTSFGQNFARLNCEYGNYYGDIINNLCKEMNILVPTDDTPLSLGIIAFTTKIDLLLDFLLSFGNSSNFSLINNNSEIYNRVVSQLFPIWLQNKLIYSKWIISPEYSISELNNSLYERNFFYKSFEAICWNKYMGFKNNC